MARGVLFRPTTAIRTETTGGAALAVLFESGTADVAFASDCIGAIEDFYRWDDPAL
jgi:hypothetical protein